MSTKVKRIIFGILIILNCILIFSFSSQDSEKSSETSGVVVNKVVDTIAYVNKNVKKASIKDTVTFIVRKCAHFSIYTLLGIWLINFANTFNISAKRKFIICVLCGMVYACSDEFHQFFSNGRSAEIRDVCIDTCGVMFGCILVIIVIKIINSIKAPKRLPAGMNLID